MTGNNKRMLVMLPLLAVAAWLALFGDKTPVDAVPSATLASVPPQEAEPNAGSPTEPATVDTTAEAGSASEVMPTRIIALRRLPTAQAPAAAPQSETMDPFAVGLHLSQPPSPSQAADQQQPALPEFPYTFIGKQYNGSQWQVFLDKGESTLIVAEGAVIDKAFRIKSIRPPEMRVVDLQSKHEHTIQIDDAQ